ncbi:MAG TPA: hypothetical protein VGH99_02430 [Pseudonocardia sp.]
MDPDPGGTPEPPAAKTDTQTDTQADTQTDTRTGALGADAVGDPACWLDRLCPECGAMPTGDGTGRCWRCGEPATGPAPGATDPAPGSPR